MCSIDLVPHTSFPLAVRVFLCSIDLIPANAMPRLLPFEELPAWMQKDPRIRRGYREELRTAWNCFISLFYIHNEFVNIWSHLLPALVYGTILLREARFSLEPGHSDIGPEKKMVQFYVATSFALMSLSVRFRARKLATRLRLLIRGRASTTSSVRILSVWHVKF